MLCQQCNKNEANMHMKRIVNGRAAEIHLCSDCARSLGYGDAFSNFGVGIRDFLSEFLVKGEAAALRCPMCKKSFEEIAEDGMVGCGECYKTFADKLQPTLSRIYGKSCHMGKNPGMAELGKRGRILELKEELRKAVENENFELAAQLRDEILSLSGEGGAL